MSIFSPFTLVNGSESEMHSVLDRAFAFGDGVFETMVYSKGRLPFETLHLERLHEGCGRLSIAVSDDRIQASLTAVLEKLERLKVGCAVVKLTVSRGVGGRGYGVNEPISPTIIVGAFPLPKADLSAAQQGITMRVCQHRLSTNPALAGIKHLNRLDNVLAKIECQHASVDDGVVRDQSGQVIEAVSSNIFIRFQGKWLTPLLNTCGVRGITRRVLMEKLLSCEEAPITIEQLMTADEVFVCNSVNGIWPVRKIDNVDYKVGQTTLKLQKDLQAMIKL